MKHIIEPLIKVVKQTGHFIRQEADNFSAKDIEYKGFNDLVSYVDKTAESQLVEGCKQVLPEAGFITEEGTSEVRGEHYNWIIDPLDGTTNFLHGLPVYAISVALMKDDNLVAGVVYEINRDECFHAAKNAGAYCNGQQIKVTPVTELSKSLLATGFPYYNFDQMNRYLEILNEFMQNTHGLRRMGSAAVDLAYVACGRFEGFFEYNLNAWDVAAGALLVQEAGGQVSDFKGGQDYIFGREILAAGAVHPAMLKIIDKHWP